MEPAADLNELMDRAGRGDAAAFGLLAHHAQDDLFRVALAQGASGADAAEIVQETFLRAYERRTSWRAGGNAVGWLRGIAMNVLRETRRRRARWPVMDADLLAEVAAGEDPGEVDTSALAKALAGLPDRQREVIACRFLRRMSVKETAEAMGCAEGTIRAATWAAVETLRRKLRTGARGDGE